MQAIGPVVLAVGRFLWSGWQADWLQESCCSRKILKHVANSPSNLFCMYVFGIVNIVPIDLYLVFQVVIITRLFFGVFFWKP